MALLGATSLGMVLSIPLASAANYTWTGTTSTQYDLPSNWSTGGAVSSVVPGSADKAVFGTTVTPNLPNTMVGNNSAGEFTFLSLAGGWTVGQSSTTVTLLGLADSTTGHPSGTWGINASALTSGSNVINSSLIVNTAQIWQVGPASGAGGTLVINGQLGGTAKLTTFGNGITRFNNGASTFSGTFSTGDASSIAVGADNALGTGIIAWNSNGAIVAAGGARSINNTLQVDNSIAFSGTLTNSGTVQIAVSQRRMDLSGANVTFSGPVVDQTAGMLGGFNLSGSTAPGTLTLTSSNSFGAGVTINANATLNINNNKAAGNGTLTMAGGTIGNTSGSAIAITNVMALSGTSGNSSISTAGSFAANGVISGTGGIVLGGTGTVTFGAANTYTGTTIVNAGTLLVKGSLSTSTRVIVAAGASLAEGKAAGAASFGTMNVTSISLTGSTSSSRLQFTLGNAGASDKYAASGAIDISGGGPISLLLTLDAGVTSLSGTYTLLSWGTGSPVLANEVTLDAGSSAAIATAVGNGSYAFQDVGNTLVLTAVPEPSTCALFGCGLAMAGWAWKRKAKQTASSS